MRWVGAWAALAAAASGCGPQAGIWLTVEGPFAVPSQCDALVIGAARASDGASIFNHTYALTAGQVFPLTLTLETTHKADVGATVNVTAAAQLGGSLVAPGAQASGSATLVARQLVPLSIVLCNCNG